MAAKKQQNHGRSSRGQTDREIYKRFEAKLPPRRLFVFVASWSSDPHRGQSTSVEAARQIA